MVELLIVIAIITFLAVLSMVILTKFVGDSRDTRRVADVAQIRKGLETYYMENQNTYPMPDNDVIYGMSTGTVNGVTVSYKGVAGDTVSKSASLAKTPKDPSNSLQGYTYGITSDQRYYQISYVLENPNRFTFNLNNYFANFVGSDGIGPFYGINEKNGSGYSSGGRGHDFVTLNSFQGLGSTADAGNEKAKVEGNFKSTIVVLTGGVYYLANMPSLIYANTGTVDVTSGNTYFVMDKNDNLPYPVGGGSIILAQKKSGNTIIQEIAGNSGAILTAMNITQYFVSGVSLSNIITGTNLASFGGATVLAVASQKVQGTSNVAMTAVGCNASSQSGYTISSLSHGATQIFNKIVQSGTGLTIGTGSLSVSCNNGAIIYGAQSVACMTGYVEGASYSCIADVCSGTIVDANGHSTATSQTVSQSWTRNPTPGICSRDCNSGYTWDSGTSSCKLNCTIPATDTHSSNTYTLASTGTINHGVSGITRSGTYNFGTNPSNGSLTATFTYSCTNGVLGKGTANGASTCPTNYTFNSNWTSPICTANTQSATCGGSIVANAIASTTGLYTQTWNGTIRTPTTSRAISGATCGYACNANYSWNGGSCVSSCVGGTLNYSTPGTYTINTCGTSLSVTLNGAGGGGGGNGGPSGGNGGKLTFTFPATASDTITVYVPGGGEGGCGTNGGYCGGGGGGGGGGGYAAIYKNGTLVGIAGGGGGGGGKGHGCNNESGGAGGAGGGSSGAAGNGNTNAGGTGGGGGSQGGGGAGATNSRGSGTNGSSLLGGDGANGGGCGGRGGGSSGGASPGCNGNSDGGAGGGGGGYYGGGGGNGSGGAAGAGGGGGSSYYSGVTSSQSHTQGGGGSGGLSGGRGSNGSVTIVTS